MVEALARGHTRNRDGIPAASGTCIIPFSFHHADELMRDMGLNTRRTRNPITEFMDPFNPAMYKGLTKELKALQSTRNTVKKAVGPTEILADV